MLRYNIFCCESSLMAFFGPHRDHDHDHSSCIHAALVQADRVCSSNGSRLTPIRRRVLELVWQRHAPIGAYEILGQLAHDGRNAAPPTVYRALDFLMAEGLIHRVETLNAYMGCSKPGIAHDSVFLICVECGTTVESQDPGTRAHFNDVAEKNGYDVNHVCAEIMGWCNRCATTSGQSTTNNGAQ